jgi:thiol-disulfide isomerase/thioredoxin
MALYKVALDSFQKKSFLCKKYIIMKGLIFIVLIVVSIATKAQKTYEATVDNEGVKVMKGLISKEVLIYEPSFKWYAENEKNYIPNAATVEALKKHGTAIQILVFGGTWCSDTQSILPKFYKILTEAGFNQAQLTLWGTDKSKKTYGALSEALGVTNVPTFIIMQKGIELGRVVEYGKTGQWDKEIGEIVNLAK